jgi:hypothetical protein
VLRDVPADVGFLCDKAAVLGDMIKRTPRVIMDATEIGWKSMDWFHPAQDWHQWHAIISTVIKPHTRMTGYFLISQATTGFSSGTPYQGFR